MKPYTNILTAACLLAGAGAFVVPAAAADVVVDRTTVRTTDDSARGPNAAKASLSLPAGIQQKDVASLGSVEGSVGNLAEKAISKNGFDNLVNHLVDQDRKRMGDRKNMNVDDLNALADKINANWKAKYGEKFDAHNDAIKGFFTVVTGEVTNPDQLVGKWPVDAGPMQKLGNAINAADKGAGKVTPADAAEAKKMFGGDVNLEKGRNVALLHIPMSHGLPAVTASLIHEASGWRFDIPNNIDADKLHANLKSALTTLSEKTDWPADGKDAVRFSTHAVIGALYGVDLRAHVDPNMKTATDR